MPATQSIFSSVARHDPFKIFKGSQPDYEKILSVLNFNAKDVARASQIPLASVRYDNKMPRQLLERTKEWANAIALVSEYFNDFNKTMLWFGIPNPLLGGISPRDMIRIGRFKKLLKFIQTSLDENKR